jgi:thymidine kinase
MEIKGHISVIIGCMYASKTSELQNRVRFYQNQGLKVKCFTKDKRFGNNKITNHNGDAIDANYIDNPSEILDLCDNDTKVVAIDEGQFYSLDLVNICKTLANKGMAVMVCGLDQDYLCRPFETMVALVAEAEVVTKLLAMCKCGGPGIRNFRKVSSSERFLEGNEDVYEAMCRRCYDKHSNNSP